jgi:hypothetical protein
MACAVAFNEDDDGDENNNTNHNQRYSQHSRP